MPKKRPSTTSSKPTSKRSKDSTLGEDLIAGFQELIAHNRGELQLRTRKVYVLDEVDVKAVREKTGLSQTEFALLYGFNPRTLQQWEQGRSKPELAVLAYLKLIGQDPKGVQAALQVA